MIDVEGKLGLQGPRCDVGATLGDVWMFDKNAILELIEAVLIFVEKHGSLNGFDLTDDEKERVLQAAVSQGLIVWNRNKHRYQLDRAGHKWLIKYSAKRSRQNFAA